jgi:hypothetical protein
MLFLIEILKGKSSWIIKKNKNNILGLFLIEFVERRGGR